MTNGSGLIWDPNYMIITVSWMDDRLVQFIDMIIKLYGDFREFQEILIKRLAQFIDMIIELYGDFHES